MKRAIYAGALVTLCMGSAIADSTDLSAEETQYLAALEAELPGDLMNNPLFFEFETYGEDVSTKYIQDETVPGAAALEVKIKRSKSNPWDISIVAPIEDGIDLGDKVVVAFWARAEEFDDASGTSVLQARLQQSAAPYSGVVEARVQLTKEWQIFELSAISQHSFGAGEMTLAFNGAELEHTFQIGQIFVLDQGST